MSLHKLHKKLHVWNKPVTKNYHKLRSHIKQKNVKISVLVYRKPMHTDQYLYNTTALTAKQVVKKGLFPPCLMEQFHCN